MQTTNDKARIDSRLREASRRSQTDCSHLTGRAPYQRGRRDTRRANSVGSRHRGSGFSGFRTRSTGRLGSAFFEGHRRRLRGRGTRVLDRRRWRVPLITGSTGQVIRLTAPPTSVEAQQAGERDLHVRVRRGAGRDAHAAVAVDAVNPGTYTRSRRAPRRSRRHRRRQPPDPQRHPVAELHHPPHRLGDVHHDILGVVASTAKLASSDSLGAPGTSYAGTTSGAGSRAVRTASRAWATSSRSRPTAHRHLRHQHLRHGRDPRDHQARQPARHLDHRQPRPGAGG